MSSLVQFVKSLRSILELPRIHLIFLKKKKNNNKGIMIEKVTEDSSVKIRLMILDILFPAKDYINKKSQTTFDSNNDIIINNK